MGGRVGGCLKMEIRLSQPQLKLKLSWVEAELGNIIYKYIYKDFGMIRCGKNNILEIGENVPASFTLTDT